MNSNNYKKLDSDKYRRGQTIFIAFFGILASIVLVSLGGARLRARDARLKADLNQVRAIAEMIRDDKDNYNSLCDSEDTLNQKQSDYGFQLSTIEEDIKEQQGSNLILKCHANKASYCVEIETSAGFYCVDSDIFSGDDAESKCNNTNFSCN